LAFWSLPIGARIGEKGVDSKGAESTKKRTRRKKTRQIRAGIRIPPQEERSGEWGVSAIGARIV
jgi:hypothetical protein